MQGYYPYRMSIHHRIATPEGKRRYVRTLFATIADRYDLITVSCRTVRIGDGSGGWSIWPRRAPARGRSIWRPAPATSRSALAGQARTWSVSM